MAELVSVAQAAAYLGGIDPADEALRGLVEQVEAAFNAACGRGDRPFQAKQTARTERQDGNGRTVLFLNYPVDDLTSIKLGYDSADPDETLDVDDRSKLIWEVGSRRVTRIDSGIFGARGAPSYLTVVYDAGEDWPVDAEAALLRRIAALYGQRGAEDVQSEAVGGYRADLASPDSDSVWRDAVAANQAPCW